MSLTRSLPLDSYITRLTKRVADYKAKWPEKYASIEQDAFATLFPTAWLGRDVSTLPIVAQMALQEEVRERVRQEMGWPDEKSFLVHS